MRPPRAARRRRPLLLVALLAAVQLASFPGHWMGAEGDEPLYVFLARSLTRGHYSLGIAPGSAAYTQVTPGWPAMLVPAAVLSGDDPVGYQLSAYLALVACDVLCFLWLRRRAGTRCALAVTALFALNPLTLSRSGVVMPELPGLAVALAVACLVDRPRPASGPLVGALLGLGYLVRPGLLPLCWAAPAALWFRGRRRDAALAASLAALTWGAWRAWSRAHGAFSDAGEALGALAAAGWGLWPRVAARNAVAAVQLWGRTLTPSGGPDGLAAAAGALLAGLGLFGLASSLRRGVEAWSLFLAGSIALHLFFPWWYERYLAALLPFALYAAWRGAETLGARGRPLAAGAAALALIPLPFQGRAVAAEARRAEPPLAGCYAWMRSSLPPDGLVASLDYARDAWYSGRPIVPLPRDPADAAPGVMARKRVRWVLWTQLPDFGSSLGARFEPRRRLEAWPSRLAGPRFRLVKDCSGGAAVYELTALTGRRHKSP